MSEDEGLDTDAIPPEPELFTLEPFLNTAARRILSQSAESRAAATSAPAPVLAPKPLPALQPAKPKPRKKPIPACAAEEIESAMELLLAGVPPDDIDPKTLRCCVEQLSALKKESAESKNYLDADYYSQFIKRSQKALTVSDFISQCTEKVAYFKEKQADAQDKVRQVTETWQGVFQSFEEAVDRKLQEMIADGQRELEAFERDRPTDLPSRYAKHSVDYIALRKREEQLLLNEDYVGAHGVKTHADALEAEELAVQRVKLEEDRQRRREAIIEKQTGRFGAFAIWLNGRRGELLRARNDDLQGPQRRLEHYSRIIEQIEQHGIAPNPCDGFSTNLVSRKQSLKAVRSAAKSSLTVEPWRFKPREKRPMAAINPSAVVRMMSKLPPLKKARPVP
jgi:hypothetical protein